MESPIKYVRSDFVITGEREWIILVIWTAHFILFLFCNESAKKTYGVSTLTVEPPASPVRVSMLLAGPPFSLFERTYFMDDPYRISVAL